jgi:hypothetical protein
MPKHAEGQTMPSTIFDQNLSVLPSYSQQRAAIHTSVSSSAKAMVRVALLLCLLFVSAVLCDTEPQTPKKAAKGVFVVSMAALAGERLLIYTQLPNQPQQQ